MYEPAQAGRRNNHKTIGKMQVVDLFLLPCQSGNLWSSTWIEACKQGHRHQGAQSMPEDHEAWWFCLCIRDSCRYILPLWFDLSHSRAGISSMFIWVPQSLSCLRYLNTDVLLVKHKGLNNFSMIYVFFNISAASHMSMFTICLTKLLSFSHRLMCRPVLRLHF